MLYVYILYTSSNVYSVCTFSYFSLETHTNMHLACCVQFFIKNAHFICEPDYMCACVCMCVCLCTRIPILSPCITLLSNALSVISVG